MVPIDRANLSRVTMRGMLRGMFEYELGIKIKVNASPEVVTGKFEPPG